MDVVTADIGQVQKYFTEKLPFAVRLPRLSSENAPAPNLGGRVTQINSHDAAYVRYELPRGRVSVFVYEAPGSSLREMAPLNKPLYKIRGENVQLQRVRGFTTMRWTRDGLVYSVVTDLPEGELLNFPGFPFERPVPLP
jgi:anti-sigma factor RsiW